MSIAPGSRRPGTSPRPAPRGRRRPAPHVDACTVRRASPGVRSRRGGAQPHEGSAREDHCVSGHCDARFASVQDAFAANFTAGTEVGAACAVAVDGIPVVDLWDGLRWAEGPAWEADTMVETRSGGTANQGKTRARRHWCAPSTTRSELRACERGATALQQAPLGVVRHERERGVVGGDAPRRRGPAARAGRPAVAWNRW